MKTVNIENIINAIKTDSVLGPIFLENVFFNSAFEDVEGYSLILSFPVIKGKYCGVSEMLEVFIIGKQVAETNLAMQNVQDKIEAFFISTYKNFGGFKTQFCIKGEHRKLTTQDKKRLLYQSIFIIQY